MKTIYITCLLALLAGSGCGSRPTTEKSTQSAQAGAAPQAAPPATGEAVPASASAPQPLAQPAAPAEQDRPAAPAGPPEAVLRVVRIPAGTMFRVRLDETLDTRRNRPGDRFTATLVRPIVIGGAPAVPRGTRCSGHLVSAAPSGRLRGRALISLSLDSFQLHGQRYEIRTTHVARRSRGHKKRNLLLIGGGSGVGTAIGAIAGGPAGALIGAGAGGAAGTAGAAITGRRNVRLPVETILAFPLRAPVSLSGAS